MALTTSNEVTFLSALFSFLSILFYIFFGISNWSICTLLFHIKVICYTTEAMILAFVDCNFNKQFTDLWELYLSVADALSQVECESQLVFFPVLQVVTHFQRRWERWTAGVNSRCHTFCFAYLWMWISVQMEITWYFSLPSSWNSLFTVLTWQYFYFSLNINTSLKTLKCLIKVLLRW